jgi:hypothetical protein
VHGLPMRSAMYRSCALLIHSQIIHARTALLYKIRLLSAHHPDYLLRYSSGVSTAAVCDTTLPSPTVSSHINPTTLCRVHNSAHARNNLKSKTGYVLFTSSLSHEFPITHPKYHFHDSLRTPIISNAPTSLVLSPSQPQANTSVIHPELRP